MQQPAFIQRDKQRGEVIGLFAGVTVGVQLLAQYLTYSGEAALQSGADFYILRAAFQRDGGQRAATLKLAVFQLLQCTL